MFLKHTQILMIIIIIIIIRIILLLIIIMINKLICNYTELGSRIQYIQAYKKTRP